MVFIVVFGFPYLKKIFFLNFCHQFFVSLVSVFLSDGKTYISSGRWSRNYEGAKGND